MSFLLRPGHPDPGHAVREATSWPLRNSSRGRGCCMHRGRWRRGAFIRESCPEEAVHWASIRNSRLHARVPYWCQVPHVMSLSLCPGAGDSSTSHRASQEMGSRRRSDFPKVTQQGPRSGIPPPSLALPLLLGSLAPAVSCSEVSGYFYSRARGSQAAEPCRLEGSRTPGFRRQGEAHCRDVSLPTSWGALLPCRPTCLGLPYLQKFFFSP